MVVGLCWGILRRNWGFETRCFYIFSSAINWSGWFGMINCLMVARIEPMNFIGKLVKFCFSFVLLEVSLHLFFYISNHYAYAS